MCTGQAYCWWDKSRVQSPYYGAYFVSEFLGSDGTQLASLDTSTSSVGTYAIYSSASKPLRLLAYNSAYYASGTRPSARVEFTGLPSGVGSVKVMRMSAPAATSRADMGAPPTIGGGGFAGDCKATGAQSYETVAVSGGVVGVDVKASEAVIVYLQ